MRKIPLAGIIAALALAMTAVLTGGGATAGHTPANKAAIAGSGLEIMSAEQVVTDEEDPAELTAASEEHLLMSGVMKVSNRQDLVFQVTAECALWTDTTNIGDSSSESFAQLRVWVRLVDEGGAVSIIPVAADEPQDDDTGKVVFCNRAQRTTLAGFADDDDDDDTESETFKLFQRTRTANAFNWITVDVPKGTYTIEVWGELGTSLEGRGRTKAAVGKRTMLVETIKLANDATV